MPHSFDAPGATAETGAPRTCQEEVLCVLFADVLSLPAVGIDDDFFEAGGDPLKASQLVRRIRDEVGLPVTARILLEAPTVAGLTRQLERRSKARTDGGPVDDTVTESPPSIADRVVVLWRQVLRTEDVTVADDFFDLGGNSITAFRLVPLIEDAFGVDAPVSVIFDHPTPRQLADALRALGAR